MFPHDGVGAGMPAPRKLSVASDRMRLPTLSEAITVTVPIVPGSMCLMMMRWVDAPEILASATKSLSLSTSTSALTLRTNELHASSTMSIITMVKLAPITIATTNARSRNGNPSHISTIRVIVSSMIPPAYPAISPRVVPIKSPADSATAITARDTLAPCITRLSTSRPTWSPPNM